MALLGAALDAKLLAAHAAKDKVALVSLYVDAADVTESLDAKCFFLTHAYIFALDVGDARAKELHTRLKAYGRDE